MSSRLWMFAAIALFLVFAVVFKLDDEELRRTRAQVGGSCPQQYMSNPQGDPILDSCDACCDDQCTGALFYSLCLYACYDGRLDAGQTCCACCGNPGTCGGGGDTGGNGGSGDPPPSSSSAASSVSSVPECASDSDCGDPNSWTYRCDTWNQTASAEEGSCGTITFYYYPSCSNGRCSPPPGMSLQQIQNACQMAQPCPSSSSASSAVSSSAASSQQSSKSHSSIASSVSSRASSVSSRMSSAQSVSSSSVVPATCADDEDCTQPPTCGSCSVVQGSCVRDCVKRNPVCQQGVCVSLPGSNELYFEACDPGACGFSSVSSSHSISSQSSGGSSSGGSSQSSASSRLSTSSNASANSSSQSFSVQSNSSGNSSSRTSSSSSSSRLSLSSSSGMSGISSPRSSSRPSSSSRSSSRSSSSSSTPVGGLCDGTECSAGGADFCANTVGQGCVLLDDFPCITCSGDLPSSSSSSSSSPTLASSRSSASSLFGFSASSECFPKYEEYFSLTNCETPSCNTDSDCTRAFCLGPCNVLNGICGQQCYPSQCIDNHCTVSQRDLDTIINPPIIACHNPPLPYCPTSSSSSTPIVLADICTGSECADGGNTFCGLQNLSCLSTSTDPCFTCVDPSSLSSTSSSSSRSFSLPPNALAFLDEPCTSNLQCITNLCLNNLCTVCTTNTDCPSNLCQSGICLQNNLPDGSSCTSDTQCLSHSCIQNICTPKGTLPAFINGKPVFIPDPSLQPAADPSLTLPATVIELPFTTESGTRNQESGNQNGQLITDDGLSSAPVTPSTGPAALAIMIAGAAAGLVYRRRR